MGKVVEVFREDTWQVQRFGSISEEQLSNGAIRYHVQIWDENRPPFLSRWFNDPVPAADFLERVKAGFDPRLRGGRSGD